MDRSFFASIIGEEKMGEMTGDFFALEKEMEQIFDDKEDVLKQFNL